MFLLNQIIVSPFVHSFDIISLFAAELKKPKIGISDKGFKVALLEIECILENKIDLT